MSNKQKKQLNENAFIQLTNELDILKTSADSWFDIEYKTSNNMLYDMFSALYALYEKCDGNDAKVQTDVRAYITKVLAKRKVTFKAKKPSIKTNLLKLTVA